MNLEIGTLCKIKAKIYQYVIKNIEYIQRKISIGNKMPQLNEEQVSDSLKINEKNFQDLNNLINEFEISKIIKDSNKLLNLFKG